MQPDPLAVFAEALKADAPASLAPFFADLPDPLVSNLPARETAGALVVAVIADALPRALRAADMDELADVLSQVQDAPDGYRPLVAAMASDAIADPERAPILRAIDAAAAAAASAAYVAAYDPDSGRYVAVKCAEAIVLLKGWNAYRAAIDAIADLTGTPRMPPPVIAFPQGGTAAGAARRTGKPAAGSERKGKMAA